MRIAIYARKSTESDDRQVQSLEDQIKALKEIALREVLAVAEVIQESKSAKAPGTRPEFARLLELIETGQIEGILTWSIDRLSRNPVDGGRLAYMLQTGKLQLIRTKERSYLPDDNALLLSIETGMSTAYIQDLRRNVRRGMQGKVDRGWLPSKAPLGYLNNPITREIDPDPDRFEHVQEAWHLFLDQDVAPRDVYRFLVQRGVTVSSRSGERKELGLNTIYGMLRNPFYSGFISYKEHLHEGKHRPMVSVAEFRQAQELLDKYGAKGKRLNARFQLSGVFQCAECGCAIVAERRRKHYPRTGHYKEYIYYHCSGARGCSKTSVTEQDLVEALEELAKGIRITKECAAQLRVGLAEALKKRMGRTAGVESALNERLRRLEQRRRELTLMSLDGEVDPAEFKSLAAEIDKDLDQVKLDLSEHRSQSSKIVQLGGKLIDAAVLAGELPYDGSYLSALGGIAKRIGAQYLSKGEIKLNVHPALKKIASFEPVPVGSGSSKQGDSAHDDSVWWAQMDDLLTLLDVA